MKQKTTKEFLQYTFSHDEIHEKGKTLARLSGELSALEDERKAVAAEYKAKIEDRQAQMNLLGRHINAGHEYRYIECTVFFNDPATGKKTTYRNDTGEAVKTEPMSGDEMQQELDFEQQGIKLDEVVAGSLEDFCETPTPEPYPEEGTTTYPGRAEEMNKGTGVLHIVTWATKNVPEHKAQLFYDLLWKQLGGHDTHCPLDILEAVKTQALLKLRRGRPPALP